MIYLLVVIFIIVLVMPFLSEFVEKNLEMFLFVMGLSAALASGVLNSGLFVQAAQEPVKITLAVFIAGLLFKWFQANLEKSILSVSRRMPFRLFAALMVIFLGLISSVITAIIAALVLVLIISALRLDRTSEVRLTVLACFSIGLGAALTPIGEPLSTIAISKMKEDFFFLMDLVGPQIIIALVFFGIMAAIAVKPPSSGKASFTKKPASENYEEIFVRALKIYFLSWA